MQVQPDVKQEKVIDIAERQWLPDYCKGNHAAFNALVIAYQSKVLTYIMRCGVETMNKDDVFQEVFFNIHRYAANYKPDKPLAPWIFTITLNTVRNYFRTKNKHKTVAIDYMDEIASKESTVEQTMENQEKTQWLAIAIKQLPMKLREPFVLATMEGLNYQDIGKILSMPLNTVKTNIRRARLSLAEQWCELRTQEGQSV